MCVGGVSPAAGMEFLLQPLFTFEASLTGPGAFCLGTWDPLSSPPECWAFWWSAKCAWLFVGIGDLNSRPHACKASILPSEPSPYLTMVFVFVFYVKHVNKYH